MLALIRRHLARRRDARRQEQLKQRLFGLARRRSEYASKEALECFRELSPGLQMELLADAFDVCCSSAGEKLSDVAASVEYGLAMILLVSPDHRPQEALDRVPAIVRASRENLIWRTREDDGYTWSPDPDLLVTRWERLCTLVDAIVRSTPTISDDLKTKLNAECAWRVDVFQPPQEKIVWIEDEPASIRVWYSDGTYGGERGRRNEDEISPAKSHSEQHPFWRVTFVQREAGQGR